MIETRLQFGDAQYLVFLCLLLVSRGMDFLSTWIGSPSLALEGNPVSRWLRWKWAIPLNAVACPILAQWPLPSVIVSTISLLLAARNFQFAWAMRTAGEERFSAWMRARLEETPPGLFLLCLAGQTLLTAAVGGALMLFSAWPSVPMGIGSGIVGYAIATILFTLATLWRHRRNHLRKRT